MWLGFAEDWAFCGLQGSTAEEVVAAGLADSSDRTESRGWLCGDFRDQIYTDAVMPLIQEACKFDEAERTMHAKLIRHSINVRLCCCCCAIEPIVSANYSSNLLAT